MDKLIKRLDSVINEIRDISFYGNFDDQDIIDMCLKKACFSCYENLLCVKLLYQNYRNLDIVVDSQSVEINNLNKRVSELKESADFSS